MILPKMSSKRVASLVGVGALLAFFAVDANAASNLSQMGTQWKSQINAALGIGKLIFGLVGFFLFAVGLFYFYKDSKQQGQGHAKNGIVALLVGTGLMIIPWLLGMFTETVASGEGDGAVNATKGTSF